jgi:hypothetical protein
MMHGNKDRNLIGAHPDRRRPRGRRSAEALPIAQLSAVHFRSCSSSSRGSTTLQSSNSRTFELRVMVR